MTDDAILNHSSKPWAVTMLVLFLLATVTTIWDEQLTPALPMAGIATAILIKDCIDESIQAAEHDPDED